MSNRDATESGRPRDIRAWILRRAAEGPVSISEMMVGCPSPDALASCLYDLEDEGLIEPTIHMRSPAYRTTAT